MLTGYGKVKLNTGESVLYSRIDNNLHHHGVTLMISKETEKSLLEWKSTMIGSYILDFSLDLLNFQLHKFMLQQMKPMKRIKIISMINYKVFKSKVIIYVSH